jgi:hypothetical protein
MSYPVIGLRIDPDLVRAMKIRALEENRRLPDITTDLWRAYLGIEARDETTNRRGSRRGSAVLPENSLQNARPGNRAEVHEDGRRRQHPVRGALDRRVRRSPGRGGKK